MTKNLGGRPPKLRPDERTLKQLAGLGAIMCTTKEAAAALDVSEPTFIKFMNDHPQAREAFENGNGKGRMSLRRSQFRLAEKNAAMAIFLGKNYLGQADRQEVTGAEGGPIKTAGYQVIYVTAEDVPHAPSSEDYETQG